MAVNNKIHFCSGAFLIASFLFFPSDLQAVGIDDTEKTAPLITPPLNKEAAAEEAAARTIQRLIRRAQVSPVAAEEVSTPAAEPAPAAKVDEAEVEDQNSNSGQQKFMEGLDSITHEQLGQISQEDLEELPPEPNAEDMMYMAPELLEWVLEKRKKHGAAEARMNERAAEIQYPEAETVIPDEAFFAVGEELSRRSDIRNKKRHSQS
jgi:hypothetical protein